MSVKHVLDAVRDELNLFNDAELSRVTGILPPHLSKTRNGAMKAGPAFILRIHEAAPEKFPVQRIRELLAA